MKEKTFNINGFATNIPGDCKNRYPHLLFILLIQQKKKQYYELLEEESNGIVYVSDAPHHWVTVPWPSETTDMSNFNPTSTPINC